ncbi:thiamine-phosphate kinase [Rothia aerolata]|uniref:Thiamine-monophosphate kinase n=1 Tax=Rothia aerolata TaxID=1812262 RepID=A0A917MR21_9MICC|nr:thiamine-phosphate kinase [Rothia aerolata]GGH58842.1 thiamine-monophosphate kinase [Rothia aerolata]
MKISDLSESQLLALFLPIIDEHNQRVAQRQQGESPVLTLGPGDDCAVLNLLQGKTVMTIDTQTENQDFRRVWASGYESGGYDVGWKASVQNLGDIAAMGAQPQTLLVSLSLPGDVESDWVKDFARGICDSTLAQGADFCTIAGGDLGRSSEISVTVTAVGSSSGEPVRRDSATPGDVLAVAGSLGAAACGLDLLETPQQQLEELDDYQRFFTGQTRPAGALCYGLVAAQSAHAMMDISDGLLRDAGRIARASGIGINIDSQKLAAFFEPLRPAAACVSAWGGKQESPEQILLRWVATGGEDHAMLAAFAPDRVPTGFTVVGRCGSEFAPEAPVTVDGRVFDRSGWDHFSG